MAKKKARKDGWKRVEQGIYKRVWADGSGGALLAKISLPGGAQKNSGSMPYFTNTRDSQATEAAVLKAVRRWRTDNLEAKDIHGQDAAQREDEQGDVPVPRRRARAGAWG